MLGEIVEKYEIGDKIRGPPPFTPKMAISTPQNHIQLPRKKMLKFLRVFRLI